MEGRRLWSTGWAYSIWCARSETRLSLASTRRSTGYRSTPLPSKREGTAMRQLAASSRPLRNTEGEALSAPGKDFGVSEAHVWRTIYLERAVSSIGFTDSSDTLT